MTDPITQARDWPATAERLKARFAPHATVATVEADDLRSALSYIAELKAALEPFKAEAERWPAGLKDRHEPFPISPLKLGDFRRAAAALQKGADHA